MADIIQINIDTLNKDIDIMQTEVNNLRQEAERAFTSIQELDSMWNGPANDAFNLAFKNDYDAMQELCKVIDSLIEYMTNARNEYRKCESAVSAEIDTIRI